MYDAGGASMLPPLGLGWTAVKGRVDGQGHTTVTGYVCQVFGLIRLEKKEYAALFDAHFSVVPKPIFVEGSLQKSVHGFLERKCQHSNGTLSEKSNCPEIALRSYAGLRVERCVR